MVKYIQNKELDLAYKAAGNLEKSCFQLNSNKEGRGRMEEAPSPDSKYSNNCLEFRQGADTGRQLVGRAGFQGCGFFFFNRTDIKAHY